MKAIGRNIIIDKKKEGITKTKGGLILAEAHREDIRYIRATVVSLGEDVVAIKEGDEVFYDKHAGHKIEIDKDTYHVISMGDVVVVL
jgi:chaperonin GroES